MVNKELILDIAKLYKKHGESSFIELADFLRNTKSIDDLLLILEVIPKSINKKKPSKSSGTKIKERFPQNLEKLKRYDSAKFEFLNEFYTKLNSKQFLTSIKEINIFREDNNLSQSKSRSHRDAIISLINDLANVPFDTLKKIDVKTNPDNNALQGWSDIILNRE